MYVVIDPIPRSHIGTKREDSTEVGQREHIQTASQINRQTSMPSLLQSWYIPFFLRHSTFGRHHFGTKYYESWNIVYHAKKTYLLPWNSTTNLLFNPTYPYRGVFHAFPHIVWQLKSFRKNMEKKSLTLFQKCTVTEPHVLQMRRAGPDRE